MKLTILGNNGPFPTPGGACSSYLLQSDDKNILLDMGSGALSNLQKYIDAEDIDIIILSHLHYDHMSDIQLLKYAYQVKKTDKKPVLLLPSSPETIHDQIVCDYFDPADITEDMELSLDGISITFLKVRHPVECYAVKICDGRSTFVFSADTFDDSELKVFAADADMLLIDACLLEKNKTKGALHFTVKEACETGRCAKRTLLTHFSPLNNIDDIRAEISFGAELSEQGGEYSF